MRSNLGRTVFVTVLAAGLFGMFLLVAPELTTAGSGSASPTTTSTTTTMPAPTTVPVTTTVPEVWDPESQTPDEGYDGSVVMTASFVSPRGTTVEVGDSVAWRIQVTNATSDELWGVFAYVEGFGAALCDASHTYAGETTDCWATGPAFAGTGNVVAWVNAWTEVWQVKDKILVPFTVTP